MSYSYNAGTDNGQIAQSVDSAHGQSILYTYDSLRRASAAKASAIPYVQNQGFEQTVFSPWTTSGQEGSAFEITDVNPHSGTYAAQITNTSLQQSFTCSPNATYTFSGWARAASGNFLDIGMTLGTNGQTWQPGVSSGTWSQFSEQLTAPSSCSGGTISIAEGTYDDLSLTSTATGSTNLLSSLNPGFESGSQTNIWSLSGGARPSTVEAHAGASSLLIPAGGSAIQTVTGCVPSSSYTVYAWYYGAGAAASLQAGGGTAATGSTNQWTLLSASGNSTGSGSLTITLSATGTGSVYFDDLSLSTVNPATPTLTWGQQFGYDGFGNLLSQTVLAGTAPGMSLTVNTQNNHVTNSGVTYDGDGNMTSDGTNSYHFDEMNRLSAAGSYLTYGYNAQDNMRVAVYNTSNAASPTAVLNLYGPSGQRLSSASYTYQGSSWNAAGTTNYVYLGTKPLNYQDDRLGSNASADSYYYPYGEAAGFYGVAPENQAFGTYIADESGTLLYANQRYLYQNWGRFLTADPFRRSANPSISSTWNRYTYSENDPINTYDPSGLCDGNYAYCDGYCPPSAQYCGPGPPGTDYDINDPTQLNCGTNPQFVDGDSGETPNDGSGCGSVTPPPPASPELFDLSIRERRPVQRVFCPAHLPRGIRR
jgi:RHS repeat-associated protein